MERKHEAEPTLLFDGVHSIVGRVRARRANTNAHTNPNTDADPNTVCDCDTCYAIVYCDPHTRINGDANAYFARASGAVQ